MTEKERKAILRKAKAFFREMIIPAHLDNTKKLTSKEEFNINPFLHRYIASFVYGDNSPSSLAKVLVYPRIMGTSITTTFGTQMQVFCSEVLSGIGSTTPGIDIEFIDHIDGKKKYCQVKSGPQTINKEDVTTITNHFKSLIRRSRTNRNTVHNDECVVGVLYGEPNNLSANYKAIQKDYPVYVGQEFWLRLTGDEKFYDKLAKAFGDVATEVNASKTVRQVIKNLAQGL